jgi:hypothetical protein
VLCAVVRRVLWGAVTEDLFRAGSFTIPWYVKFYNLKCQTHIYALGVDVE